MKIRTLRRIISGTVNPLRFNGSKVPKHANWGDAVNRLRGRRKIERQNKAKNRYWSRNRRNQK